MKYLKFFVNVVINKGYIDFNNYVFRRYKIKMKEGKYVFLLLEEMKKLEEVFLIGRNSCLEYIFDVFLFCCYMGLWYFDFVNLNEKNIVKMDGKLWLIFDFVKIGIEVKLFLNLLFEGKVLILL